MQLRLSPALKGLITALLMMALALLIDAGKNTINPKLQYLVYIVYAAGIAWAIGAFFRSARIERSFAALFGQGFRCFIVVTLLMVGFTAVYVKMHPELAAQEARITKEYYQEKKDKTPAEIEEIGEKAKKQYPIAVISLSIFRYLIIGAVLSAGISALLTRRQ